MNIKSIKRPITLLEILIVMALIATTLGVMSLQISKALQAERFERAVEQVVSKLNLAQEIMLDFQTDVQVSLKQDGQQLDCQIVTAKILPDYMEKTFNRYFKIKGIERIEFNGKTCDNLYFDACGSTSKGTLSLFAKGKNACIILNGYPTQIKQGSHDQKTCQAIYPEEILSAL